MYHNFPSSGRMTMILGSLEPHFRLLLGKQNRSEGTQKPTEIRPHQWGTGANSASSIAPSILTRISTSQVH